MKHLYVKLTVNHNPGGAIMMLAMFLFEAEFLNIVSISFTALIFNELLMVALEINTWHVLMIWSEIMTLAIYLGSMAVLTTDFGTSATDRRVLFLFFFHMC
jgi:phospholipid-translocating ATPase